MTDYNDHLMDPFVDGEENPEEIAENLFGVNPGRRDYPMPGPDAVATSESTKPDPSDSPPPPTRLTLEELQAKQREWVEHNFPNRTNYHPLLGVVEEIGELCHAHLKYEQGIRSMSQAKYMELAEDAVGDIIIYLADYCSANGIDLQECLEDTWSRVKQRDWIKDPVEGSKE